MQSAKTASTLPFALSRSSPPSQALPPTGTADQEIRAGKTDYQDIVAAVLQDLSNANHLLLRNGLDPIRFAVPCMVNRGGFHSDTMALIEAADS
ncbi:MAG TPA: hypothetical protein VHO91_05575 [Rhodopila sp.]|nr:hypothetical protein [Rhodopila sp.]